MASDTNQKRYFYSPYKEHKQNFIYNLLFCDNPEIFNKADIGHWPVLLADIPDPPELLKIANDQTVESRQRILAFNRLRECGVAVPPKQLLCAIFEVSMPHGMDTLAAFSGRQVRFISYMGKMFFYEIGNNVRFEDQERQKMTDTIESLVGSLFVVSQKIVDKIGPWDKPRLPPPAAGLNRMTFLVSDGLYFGQGSFEALNKDPLARQFVLISVALLKTITECSVKYAKDHISEVNT